MSVEERKNILLKPCLKIMDIAKYFCVGKTKAWEIKNLAINKYEGFVETSKDYVKTESVMQAMGLNRLEEIMFLAKVIETSVA